MIKVAISGATGRMGKMLIEAVLASDDLQLVGTLASPSSDALGSDPAAFLGKKTGLCLGSGLSLLDEADVLIDFSRPQASLQYLEHCVSRHIAMVIGTTGFDAQQKVAIEQAAETIPVVFSANMSAGVNVTFQLIAEAARLLPDYDCEIVEMHHCHKVDAPSGTALEMGRTVARARHQNFDDVAVLSREGHVGERTKGTIGFASLRGGDVVGDHTVIFAGCGERIEITHKSGTRAGYAAGALHAARFLTAKDKGLFLMSDVLGIK